MRYIAILPTGDWSVIEADGPVCFYEMTDDELSTFEADDIHCFNIDLARWYTDLGKLIGTYDPVQGFQPS